MTADFDCCDQPKLLLRSQNQSGIEVDGLTHARSHPSPSGSDARSSVSHSTPTASVYNTRIISSQTLVEGSRASLDGSIHTTTTTLQQQQSNTSPFRYLARIWRWELLTWLLGTAGLLANITLLIWFNGVQQQYWNSSVQITAFVAALAQLSQSALLVPIASSIGQSKWKWLQKERKAIDIEKFDLASRGPDGALRLLWHLRLRPHLVSLGALSTIMMLAFPTFVQQSVAVNTRRAKFHTDSQTYVKRAGQVSVSNLESFSFNEDISNSVAMFQALVTEYINPANVTGHCATDICTWEPYTTLSICVTTEDISESLVHGDAISGDLASPPRLVGHDHAFSIEPGTTLYTYTQSVGDLYDHWPLPVDDIPTSLPDYPNLYLIFYDPCKKDVQDEQRPFDAQDITRWTAFRATFRPCVQIYNTTYASSWQSATMTSPESLQWYLTSSLSFCTRVPAFGDEICINSTLLRAIGESLRATYSFSGKRRAIVGASKPREGSEGSVIKVVENLGSNPPAWSTTLLQDIRSNLSNTDECNEEAFERFEHRVQNIAASVSIEIRNNGDSPGSIVVGTAWITQPIIEVTFMWLTMPIVLYLGITAFFFATMVRTAGAPPWKSSPLALVRCADPNNKITTTEQFKTFAESTKVRLDDNGERWHLVNAGHVTSTSADKDFRLQSDNNKR